MQLPQRVVRGGEVGRLSGFSWSSCHTAYCFSCHRKYLALPRGAVELRAFLPKFPRALTCLYFVLGVGILGQDGWFPHSFFPANCWQQSSIAGYGYLSTLWDNEGVLVMLLITEILHNLILHAVPPRVNLGDHILISLRSCSAPLLCPAVRVFWSCFTAFWS